MKSKIKKSLGNLSKKVVTANKIEQPIYEVKVADGFDMKVEPIDNTVKITVADWINQVELYCGEMGILPNDLILCHKEAKLGLKSKKGTKTPKDGEIGSTEVGSAKNNRSNWFKDYKKAKTGISE